ncbi:MAG: PqiC family protein [Desulfobacterales bacterium]
MRETPFFRGLQVIAAAAVIITAGCLGKSSPTRFYDLTPLTKDQARSEGERPARNKAVGVGPVNLADYLDQSSLVTRTGDNRLIHAEFDQWAGSLKNNLVNTLAENIGLLLPTDRLYIYPWRLSGPVDYQVLVDVVQFDGRPGADAMLVARWSILGSRESEPLVANRSSIREPVQGPDYAAMVAAQSRALAKLSREIVAAIQAASQGRLPEK